MQCSFYSITIVVLQTHFQNVQDKITYIPASLIALILCKYIGKSKMHKLSEFHNIKVYIITTQIY